MQRPNAGVVKAAMLLARRHWILVLIILALLAVVAYLPTLTQPLLEDDYPNLERARLLGAPDQWQHLMSTVFRFRATSEWLFWASYRVFGLWATGYYVVTIVLHVVNTWLVYAVGVSGWEMVPLRWRLRPDGSAKPASVNYTGPRMLAFWAAAFFAIAEGHQEAVMWFSACNELLQFFFGVAALLAWLRFLDGGLKVWYVACFVLLTGALVSKESAPIFGFFFLLPLLRPGWRKRAMYVVPLVGLAFAAGFADYYFRASSFRFQDGSFSFSAPFGRVWLENFARMLGVWGMSGLAAALAWRWSRYKTVVAASLFWAGVALLPYCFLTYSTRIPSRQTYLASAGVAFVVAAGWSATCTRFGRHRRALTAALCVLAVASNVGYLWTRKRRQFLERAQPTEELIKLARRSGGSIYVACFPRQQIIAEDAVRLAVGEGSRVIWDEKLAQQDGVKVQFCYR